MKKLFVLLLSVLMVIGLAACGSNNGGGNGGEGGGTAPADEVKTFTYAVGGEPTYMDPAKCGDSVTAEIHNEIWYPLFYLVEDGSTEYGDCVSYEVSDDGLVYTFHLDPNAKWSDGVAITADQYVYGIKRCI